MPRRLFGIGSRPCSQRRCSRSTAAFWTRYCDLHDGRDLEGETDRCPACRRPKIAEFDLCADCNAGNFNVPPKVWSSWINRDPYERSGWYLYILKFPDGERYVGVTDRLARRLGQHRDGQARATRGKTWRLEYFTWIPELKQRGWLGLFHLSMFKRSDVSKLEAVIKAIVKEAPTSFDVPIQEFAEVVGFTRPTESPPSPIVGARLSRTG